MSEELNYKRQCPFCDGVIDFDIDYCESYEIGEDTVNLWGYCNKCDYDGRKEFQAWGGGWQKAEKEIERYKTVEPTISTFEDLNSILNVGFFRNIKEDDNPFIHHCAVGDLALRYYKSGIMSFCGKEFKNITPQQALNVINCLKLNLGG